MRPCKKIVGCCSHMICPTHTVLPAIISYDPNTTVVESYPQLRWYHQAPYLRRIEPIPEYYCCCSIISATAGVPSYGIIYYTVGRRRQETDRKRGVEYMVWHDPYIMAGRKRRSGREERIRQGNTGSTEQTHDCDEKEDIL